MRRIKDKRLGYCFMSGISLLLGLSGCSSELSQDLQDGMPVTIRAEVAEASVLTKSIRYDIEAFQKDDQISVTKTYGGVASAPVYYTRNASGDWSPSGSALTLQGGAEFKASYPVSYSAIVANQSAADNYLKSNKLETASTKSRDGVVSFTTAGAAPFVHRNVKLTLEFKGTISLSKDLSGISISGIGLRTNSGITESITPYKPTSSGCCCIVYPKDTNTDIKVSLTYDGVAYSTELTGCPLVSGTHYKYVLTIKNDILVPEGFTITGWKNNTEHTGDFIK